MNQSHSKAIRYVVAGLSVLALLILIEWFALREPPTPTNEQPAQAVSASPRDRPVAPLFRSMDDEQSEAPTNQVVETVETNAAVIYRQAFALYDALSKEQKEIVSNWRTNVDASVEAELCEKIQPICELMHQATTVTNCDWGLERPITFETLFPHLNPCRNLARAAAWSVAHCRKGDPAGAIDDLVATVHLGRNVSPGVLIEHLVGLAIQSLVIDSVAEQAGTLAVVGDTRLVRLFDDARYDESLSGAFEGEADENSREADKLATMPPDEAMQELKSILSRTDIGSELESIEAAQAISYIRQAAELQREWAKALELPEAEYREFLSRIQAAEKGNPLVELFLGGLESSVNRTQRATVSAAMLVAGLSAMRDGPNALQSHPDPSTGEPFTYTQTADGFQLESGYHLPNGQPLKLRFK